MEVFINDRNKIEDSIRNIRVEPNQPLRDVKVPPGTYDLAKEFVKRVPNALTLINGGKLFLRYPILYSLGDGEGIYDLLVGDAEETTLSQAESKMVEWQEALSCLLRYALNLLLAPKRPEFQNIKVLGI